MSDTDTSGSPGFSDADRDRPIPLETGDDLDRLVASDRVVLVDFYTKGCTLCDAVEPVVGTVARASDVTVATLNPQTDLSLVETYDVRSVPTLLLFVDGEPVGRLAEGFVGVEEVLRFVAEHAPAAVPGEALDGDARDSEPVDGSASDND